MKSRKLFLARAKQRSYGIIAAILCVGLAVAEVSLAGTPADWVGTWHASPVTTSTLSFNDQTLRESMTACRVASMVRAMFADTA